jgi:hypothetical protein
MHAKCSTEFEVITPLPRRETLMSWPNTHVTVLNVFAYNTAAASTSGFFSIGNTVLASSSQTVIVG